MKPILTFLLVLTCTVIFAQPVVLNRKDAPKASREWQKEYGNEEGEMIETPYSIVSAFQSAYAKILDVEKLPNMAIVGTLYLNAEGKIDYFVFDCNQMMYRTNDTTKYNFDSLNVIISEKIGAFLPTIVSKRTVGRKATLGVYAGYGTYMRPGGGEKKQEVKKDSVINKLDEALTTTDTLKIKTLGLTQNLLTAVPDVIYRFPNLEQLFLGNNDIETVDIDLARLPKLKQLDLSGNILKEESIHFTKNKSLKLLNLQKNLIHNIPLAVRNCKGLETLWLGSNKINGLTNASFKKLKSVRDLNFYKGGITVLPKGIRKMKNLEVLDLYYNKLEQLPNSIVRLKRLTHFAVSHNQITQLPKKIDKLKNVHTLYAHHNHLSKLPERIVKMQKLKIMDLGYNWFTNFPAELTAFVNLQELDLSSNNFPEFPEQLLKINHLDKLYLRGNPFLKEDAEKRYNQQLGLLKNKNIEVFY
jgi:Leucine-rich repeat (LRR) protein